MSDASEQRILVTGYRGFLGATLMLSLKEVGYEPIPFTGDIRDRNKTLELITAAKPDYIIHAAAKTDVGACEREPEETQLVNAVGTENVVTAAKALNIPILYVSAVSVFDGQTGNYKETDMPNPVNVYNITKREGEKSVLAYERGSLIRVNPIGVHPEGSRGKNFVEWLIQSFETNKDISLFTDVHFSPLSNWTLSEIIISIIRSESPERIYHLGSSDVVSKADIGTWIAKYFPEYTGDITLNSVDSIADGVTRPKEMWLNLDETERSLNMEMPKAHDEVARIFKNQPLGEA